MAHDSPTALKVQQLQQYTSFAFKAAKVAKWKIIKTIQIPSEEQNNTSDKQNISDFQRKAFKTEMVECHIWPIFSHLLFWLRPNLGEGVGVEGQLSEVGLATDPIIFAQNEFGHFQCSLRLML